MRFQTEYTCGLMNAAHHAAFGKEAAEMVLKSLDGEWPKVCLLKLVLPSCFIQDGKKQKKVLAAGFKYQML